MTELTHEELTRLLDYDPETGVFHRRIGIGKTKSGDVAGNKGDMHNTIVIGYRRYSLRRLAWFYVNGELPRNNLFVKNGDSYDDRIDNIGMLPDKPKELTHEYLNQCIDYNPETGDFKWKITQSPNKYGDDAFYFRLVRNDKSMCTTQILHKQYSTLRLIVFWMTGYMPSPNRVVMPIDNNLLNMRWNNIKVGSWSDAIIKKRAIGRIAMKGVSWSKARGKYKSGITINGKKTHLGYYATEAEAHEAYMKAARKHYGELANDGYQHAMYHLEYEPVEREPVADELVESMEHAVDIAEGKVEPAVVHDVGF